MTATTTSPRIEDQQRIEEVRVEIVRLVNARLNLVIFLALPLFGLIVRGLFRRSGRNYAECMAFVFFTMGHVFLLGISLALIQLVAPRASVALRVVLQVGYLTWAAIGFFGDPLWKALLKTILAVFSYMIAVISMAATLAGPRILQFLRGVETVP